MGGVSESKVKKGELIVSTCCTNSSALHQLNVWRMLKIPEWISHCFPLYATLIEDVFLDC